MTDSETYDEYLNPHVLRRDDYRGEPVWIYHRSTVLRYLSKTSETDDS